MPPASCTMTAAEANQHALALRAAGRLPEAVAALQEAVAAYPARDLYDNLALALCEAGEPEQALAAYDQAIALDPAFVPAYTGSGMLLARAGRFAIAEQRYLAALRHEPLNLAANMAMHEIALILGRPADAVTHQARALSVQRLFSTYAPQAVRSILVLFAPGDYGANVPIDFLFDLRTTTIHKYFVPESGVEDAILPPGDLVFNAIAPSDEAATLLTWAQEFRSRCRLPWINDPGILLGMNRESVSAALATIPGCTAPSTARACGSVLRTAGALAFPIVIRPVGSHAGNDFELIGGERELGVYLDRCGDERDYYVSPFIDYRSADGFFRKYRIIFIDGEPYPFHQAISPNWMVHYYNAPMCENAWMREEEERFLAALGNAFTPALQQTLRDVAKALQLEYCGIDCSIGRDGELIVFEADTANLVHTLDDRAMFPYKHTYVPRIYRALETYVDSLRARSC